MKFQEKVWKLLEQIPEGKVAKYGIIAKKLNSKAFRAVGNAYHNNPNAPKIPCHRVVNSNGNVGGFAAGIDNKIKLLEKEGVKIEDNKVVNFKEKIYHF